MNTRQVSTSKKWVRSWRILVILGGFAAVWFLSVPILVYSARWLNVGERPRAADFVMVLPGGQERRPFVAAAMLRSGLVQCILTPQTVTSPADEEGLVQSAHLIMHDLLLNRGVREDQIEVLPGQSESTWTDALALSRFLQEHPQVTVAIVTDDFHTRRSSWAFQRALGTDAKRVYFVSAPVDEVSPNDWWTTEEGLLTYLGEFCKLFFYVITDSYILVLTCIVGVAGLMVYVGRKLFSVRK